jgi:hypothetical protein
MKKTTIISAALVLSLLSCTTYKPLNGSYTYGNSIEFKFTESPNRFEYFSTSEMGLLEYSTGEWKLEKSKVYLLGFTNNNLKILKVESTIGKNNDDDRTKISINYTNDEPANHFIRTDIMINDSVAYPISKDTLLQPNFRSRTLQVKSYLSYKGLLSSNPKIDTLFSPKMKVDFNNVDKTVILKIKVNLKDFARTKLTDTLKIVNNHTLLYFDKIKLKKFTQ